LQGNCCHCSTLGAWLLKLLCRELIAKTGDVDRKRPWELRLLLANAWQCLPPKAAAAADMLLLF
jgi:hypothetical protein